MIKKWLLAMVNAVESARRIVDYVTKSNDEDGVAFAIENMI